MANENTQEPQVVETTNQANQSQANQTGDANLGEAGKGSSGPGEAGNEGATGEQTMFDKTYVERIRQEAAGYRVRLREAQEALAKAKTVEEFENVQAELAKAQQRLMVQDHTRGIPDDVVNAPWINWPTDEEGIKATAASLRSFVASKTDSKTPPSGGDLSGGLDPSNNSQLEDMDPASLAKKVRSFRNRGNR